jgi:putative glutamine amidotransferase
MKHPIAGITPNWYANEPPTDEVYGKWMYGLNQKYVTLAGNSGFVPVALMPHTGESAARDAAAGVDLIVLTGGGDPDPVLCSSCVPESRCLVETRFGWDMDVYLAARESGMPIIGICLGIQLIAIAEGEELIDDILAEDESCLDHHGSGRNPRYHDVEMVSGTRLHSLLGPRRHVSTFHHQAVRRPPEGFIASAYSPDGILEGMESPDGRILAVQWHPERDDTGPAIFGAALELMR